MPEAGEDNQKRCIGTGPLRDKVPVPTLLVLQCNNDLSTKGVLVLPFPLFDMQINLNTSLSF